MVRLQHALDAFIKHDLLIRPDLTRMITWSEMCAVTNSMFQFAERECSGEVLNVTRSVDLLTSWTMDIFDV